MDDIDRRILALLQKDGRMSLKAIAEKTFLSSPAVSARIERLEREQIITGYHAKVDPVKLGYPITAWINLEVLPEEQEELYAWAAVRPNVLECCQVTGEYPILLRAVFGSTGELEDFLGGLQRFGKTNTQTLFSAHVGPREAPADGKGQRKRGN